MEEQVVVLLVLHRFSAASAVLLRQLIPEVSMQ